MASLQTLAPQAITQMGGSLADAAKAARAGEVRRMWAQVMRSGGDDYLLEHTNNVFILDAEDVVIPNAGMDDRKDVGGTGAGAQLLVYVDESIVAAELNARRELVKLQFLQMFGQEIDTFKIFISYGQQKKHHPFAVRADAQDAPDKVESVPLTPQERSQVAESVAGIQNPRLRRAVERAQVADREWKKGLEE
jgi:hypothetical protein